MSRQITKGATDQSTVIKIVDSADGTPETGVTSATAGLDLQYRREGAAAVALTESDLAAVDSAHSDGGMIHIGAGYYRVDLPDAAVATGADGVLVFGTVTGMVVIGAYHELVDAKQTGDSFARLGAPAGASIAADLAVIEAQTDDIGVAGAGLTAIPWNAAWDAEVQSEVADALDAALPVTPTSGSINDRIKTNLDATVSTRSSHAAADVWSVGTRALTDKAGFSLSAAGIQAIWDALTSALTTVGSIGKLLVDNVNATISSRSSHSAADVWSSGTRTITGTGSGALTAASFAPGAIDAAATAADYLAEINAEVKDVLETDTHAEPAAVPAATSSLKDKINWLFALARNKITQTATTQTLRNDGDAGNIATAAVSDDSTTFTRGKWA